jgi:MFS family permease
MLILARGIQGLGGGPLNPLAMTILLRGLPPERRGRTASTLALPMLVAPLLGPVVGGTLIDSLSWRVVFLLVIPPALLAMCAVARWAPVDMSARRVPLSLTGLVLLVPGSAGIVYAASAQGIDPSLRAAVLLSGILALAGFARQSLHSSHPLLRVQLLADRRLVVGLVVLTLFAAAYFGPAVLTPTYVQVARSDPATIAGALGVPAGLATALTLQIATRLVDRLPARRIVVTGLALAAVAIASTRGVLDTGTPYIVIGGLAVILGIGSGAVLMPTMTAATRHLDGSDLASGSVLTVLAQQLASATGTATVTGLFSSLTTLESPPADLVAAHRSTLLLPLGLTLVAAAVAATTLDNTRLSPKVKGQLQSEREP